MPRQTVSNRSRHREDFVGKNTSGGFSTRDDFGRQVRFARIEKGWTVKELASRASVNNQTVYNAERGLGIRLTTRAAISKALGFTSDSDSAFDSRSLRRLSTGATNYTPDPHVGVQRMWKAMGRHHECAWPGCNFKVAAQFVACAAHWVLVPMGMKDEFKASLRRPERREVWKRIERYLAMRARFKGLAS